MENNALISRTLEVLPNARTCW